MSRHLEEKLDAMLERLEVSEARIAKLEKRLSEEQTEEVREAFARLEEKEADLQRVQRLRENLRNEESEQ